ncbi:hypothetical protein [Paraliomyxa miuraensis]|uniref:hypothetical protein n=1 Tax=Paraliomyxa miuraensis TaxID=376150 RepID=UPI00224FAF6E|nr:hypothetical protein [Paraliomyxa miuraensis]MCX4245349.1 hypothetical protein [Paraliomyxa miuraensis]
MHRWIALGMLAVLGCGCGPGSGRGNSDGGTDGMSDGTVGDSTDGVDETGGPPVGPEAMFELRLSETTPAPLTLQMNKEEVAELFGDRADEILLLELDSTPLLTNTLTAVRDACGLAWQFDDSDPNHDCSLTPLGQTFMGPDGTWQSSAEYAMVRLLTMTPANLDVSGTSSEGLQELADVLSVLTFGLVDDYSDILADALAIPRTQTVITTASLVAAFRDNFVASHPAVGPSGALGFTLGDALSNLTSLTDRYGPQDGHPGIVDPSFPVQGEVFGPDFKMIAEADSNLRLVEGVDADGGSDGPGKGYASIVVDQTGPTYEDELEFHFDDPERFRVEGLIEDLLIDMRFKLGEYPQFVPSCTGTTVCHDNLPGAPTSPQSVWSRNRWDFEYLVTYAAYLDYQSLTASIAYLLGSAEVNIGQGGNPPGWVEYYVLLDLGNPPEDQYIWETILEVAQVRLHDSGFSTFPEGVELAFTVEDIPCGLTGSEAAEAVRPYLQEQASVISDFLLGNYKEDNDPVDFYYRRAEDGVAYVYFTATNDRAEGVPYAYATPGFFHDASLTDKASSTSIAGVDDEDHEKLALPAGESHFYFEDDQGERYRARFMMGNDDSTIEVAVAPVL